MDRILKAIDWIVWGIIIGGIGWFFYGCYQLINLFFMKG